MPQIAHLDIGDIWKPKATFTIGGSGVDPTQLVVRLLQPDGTLTVRTESSPASLGPLDTPVSRPSIGQFVFHQSLGHSGHWYARFEGTGAATASEDFEVIVDPSPFYDGGMVASYALVTLGELKDWLAEKQIDTTDDLRLAQGINAASTRIGAVAGRQFYESGPDSRTFAFCSGSVVDVGDLSTLASLTAGITDFETGSSVLTLSASDYDGLPYNRKAWEPITALRFRSTAGNALVSGNLLNLTGFWGFPSVPEDIRHATMDAVAYWLDRDVEHFRQDLGTGNIGEAGQTVFLGGSPPTVFPLPPESYRIATSYTRKLVR